MKRKKLDYLVASAKWQNDLLYSLYGPGVQSADETVNPTPPPPPPPPPDDD